MAPEDKRGVSRVSGSCQVDILICERRGGCLHDSAAGETAGLLERGGRSGHRDQGPGTRRSAEEEKSRRAENLAGSETSFSKIGQDQDRLKFPYGKRSEEDIWITLVPAARLQINCLLETP